MTIDEAIENLKYGKEIDMCICDMIPNILEWLKLLKWYQQGMEDIPDESGVLPKDIYAAGYNKAIYDYHRLIAEEIKNDPTNPYLLHFYNANNYIKECLTKK